MSYSQDPDYWKADDPRAKSTTAGKPKQALVLPYRAEAPRLTAEDLPMPTVEARPISLPPPQPALPQLTKSGHIRTTDDPVTNAKAVVLLAHTLGWWFSVFLGAGVFALYLLGYYSGVWLFLLEIAVVAITMAVAVAFTYERSLAHGAGGIARHEHKTVEQMNRDNNQTHETIELERIHSQERIAEKTLGTYLAVQTEKWRMDVEARKQLPGE